LEGLTVSDPQLVAQALLDMLDAGLRRFNDDQFIDWFHEWSFSTRAGQAQQAANAIMGENPEEGPTIRELRADLAASREAIARVESETAALRKELAETRKEVERRNSKISSLEAGIETQRLRARIESLEQSNEDYRKSAAHQDEEANKLRERLSAAETARNEARRELKQYTGQ
jgi:chromosome segregation ATPase